MVWDGAGRECVMQQGDDHEAARVFSKKREEQDDCVERSICDKTLAAPRCPVRAVNAAKPGTIGHIGT